MARNEPVSLTRDEARRAYALRDKLNVGETVTLHYWKRPNKAGSVEAGVSTGEVAFFNGEDGTDKMSVTLNTPDKGARTINLVRVVRFQIHD